MCGTVKLGIDSSHYPNNRWCPTVEDETIKKSVITFKLMHVTQMYIFKPIFMTVYKHHWRYLDAPNEKGCQLVSKLTFLRFSGGGS